MFLVRCLRPARALAAVLAAAAAVIVLLLGARPGRAQTRTATLAVGQAVNFATGKVTTKKAEGDFVFQFIPPQQYPGRTVFNAFKGELEYRSEVMTDRSYPLVKAARTGSFKTAPNLTELTVGDVNAWTPNEYEISPGRYLLVRGAVDQKHYLVHITKLTGKISAPGTWRLSFTYKPVTLALGAAGAAGTSRAAMRGVLTFRELQRGSGGYQIVDLDLATGRVTPRLDGFDPAASANGDIVYVDGSGALVVAGPDNRAKTTIRAQKPFSTVSAFPPAPVLSPDGSKIAVVERRSKTIGNSSIAFDVDISSVVVRDRGGDEIAVFPENRQPAWTPDGRLVMVGLDKHGLFLSDAGLKTLTRIDPNLPDPQQPAVSPDGKQVAFLQGSFSQGNRVWVMNLDGANLRQLTGSGRDETAPAWSPDGKYIALSVRTGPFPEIRHIEIAPVAAAGGKSIPVTDALGSTHQPEGRISWR